MARQFNGSSDKGAVTASLAGVAGTGAWSIHAWVYPDSTSAGAHNIFSSGGTGIGFMVQLRRDGSDWNLYIIANNSLYGATFVGGVSAGVYTAVGATYDGVSGGNIKLYVGGVLKQTTAIVGLPQRSGTGNNLGDDSVDSPTTQLWNGRLAELGIWGSDIGQTNMTALAGATARNAALDTGIVSAAANEYWELIGTTSPEPNTGVDVSGADWTMTGTTQVDGPFAAAAAGWGPLLGMQRNRLVAP